MSKATPEAEQSMSECKHQIFHSGATEDPITPVCAECGKDLMVLYIEREEELDKAREQIDKLECELCREKELRRIAQNTVDILLHIEREE